MGVKSGILSKALSSIYGKYNGTETGPCEPPAPQSLDYQPKYPEEY